MAKKTKKEKKAKKTTFTIVNDNDGNDSFEVEASNPDEAAHLALEQLGWWVAK